MEIIDISMEIKEKMLYYPGDPGFSVIWEESFPKDNLNVSRINMGVHTGTHVDAPLHFLDKASGINQIPLSHFYV